MVEPRGRRLNPLKPAAPHDLVPWYRPLFGVPAKKISASRMASGCLLTGIDDGAARRGRLDLRDVLRFDGVAEDDIHGVDLGSGFRVQVRLPLPRERAGVRAGWVKVGNEDESTPTLGQRDPHRGFAAPSPVEEGSVARLSQS